MNLTLEASSTDALTAVEVTTVIANRKGGFAVTPSGEQVFLCQGAARYVGFGAGDTIHVLLTPNTVNPENTPWYAAAVRRNDDYFISQNHAEWVLRQGGVMVAADLAEEVFGLADEGARAAAGRALQGAYRAGRCAVFVLFRSPEETGLRKCWYTVNPDLADVDEWEDGL